MKKRIISALLAVCLALALLPVNAWAAEGDGSETGNLTWNYDESTKTVTVSGTGTITRADVSDFWSQPLLIDSLVIGEGITAIGDDAFGDVRSDISSVTIPSSVKSIGAKAFYDCHRFASITIPGDDVEVGDEAFANCYSLTNLIFSGSVKSIGAKAFYDCNILASVTIPGDDVEVGDEAFANCYGLSSVIFPGSVKSIGAKAFYDCDKLAGVIFSGDVGPIGNQAFAGCEKLAAVTFSGKVDSIGESAFYNCESLVKFSVPDGASSLGKYAFYDCGKLTTVYIPAGAAIGANLFYGCRELMDVYYGGTQQQWALAGEPNVPIDDGLPIIHCGATGLPPTTAHNAQELFELLEAGKDAALTYIDLDADIQLDSATGGLVISEKRAVQLDLKGHRITSGTVFPMVTVSGDLTVLDSTATGEPVVNDDDSVAYAAGGIFATSIGDKAAIAVEDGGSFTLRGGKIDAAGTAISADNNQAQSGVWEASRVQIDSGYVRAGSGPAVSMYRRGGVTVNGGVLVSGRNTVIHFSDEDEARSNYYYSGASIYGGTLISQGAPAGSLPCGIYFPQHGSVTFLYGGEIRARGGIGILMRAGWLRIDRGASYVDQDIIVTKAGTGKIGSSPLELESGHCVVLDEKSGYADQEGAGSLRFQLRQSLPEKFQPYVYVSDGNELKTATSDSSSPELYYSFGPSTAYTVTFNANGSGADDIVLKTNSDQRIEEWPTLTRAGYVFRGWTTGPEGLYEVADNYRFKGDTTLYAIWIPEGSHFVDFIVYEEEGIHARYTTGPDGLATGWPSNPTHSPWAPLNGIFAGWYLDWGNNSTEIERTYAFTEDTTLYAHWTVPEKPYTVTFDLNGGVGTGGEKTTDTKGVLATDQWPEDPTREGYLFKGWARFRDSSFTVRPEDNFYSDTTLYARWAPVDGYAVTFNLNEDGSAGTIYRTEHTTADGTLTSWPDEPQRAGYRFRGWYFDRDGGYRLDLERTYSFSRDTTLYAHWTENTTEEKTYTITFNPNGGTGGGTLTTGTNGSLSTLPANPTRTGYTFDGWYTAETGGEKVTLSAASARFDKDTTLYAHWTQNSTTPADKTYTITFDANGGSVSPASAVTNADGKVTPPTPTRDGYTFSGWYTAKSGGSRVTASTKFTKDTTVYARWSQPSATRYQVITPNGTYGGSFSASHSSAVPGTLVIVTVSPWTNFALNQLSVIRADTGLELSLTARYANQYSFLMPDSDVRLVGSYTQTYTGAANPGSSGTSAGGGNPGGSSGTSAGARPVNWYYSGGYIRHVTDGLVPTGAALTRDMLVSVLYNLDSTSSGQPTIWAAENNIVPDIYQSGLWGTDMPISREQAAMILFCYARHKGYATNQASRLTGYADYSQLRVIARPAMAWSCATGLIPATSARTLSPQALLTCAEANAILTRFVSGVASAW